MLVCRRMEHDIRTVLFENGIDAVRVADRTDQHHQIKLWMVPHKLQLDVICRVLIDIQNDQPARRVVRDLPAQLAPDGASPSGHKDRLFRDILHDLIQVRLYRLPSQKVLQLHVPECGDIHFAIDDLRRAGQRLHPASGLLADLIDLLSALSRQGRDGDEYLLHPVFLHHLRYLVMVSRNRHAQDFMSDL